MSALLQFILGHEDSFRKARLPSLYSDFSTQKQTNPDGYFVNVEAWQKALAHAALAGKICSSPSTHGDILVLTANNALVSDLESKEFGCPVALSCVIDEAIKSNAFIPLDFFLSSAASPFRRRWIPLPSIPSPGQVMGWGLSQIRDLLFGCEYGQGKLKTTELVIADNVKEVAKKVVATAQRKQRTATERIYSRQLFEQIFGNVLGNEDQLSSRDFDVILVYLSRDEKIISYDGTTIKFLTGNYRSPIGQEDISIANLRTAITDLSAHVTALDERISSLTLAAKKAVAYHNRPLAVSSLRSRKLAEKYRQQRGDTLVQLEETYLKLDQARDQVSILQVMKDSADSLRILNAQIGGVDNVENIIDKLRDEIDEVNEIGTTMTAGMPGKEIDEGEVDEELETMASEERERKAVQEAEAQKEKEAREADETSRRSSELEKNDKVHVEGEKAKTSTGAHQVLTDDLGDMLSNMSIRDKTEKEKGKEKEKGLSPVLEK